MPSTLSERWGTIRSYSFLAFLAMRQLPLTEVRGLATSLG